MIYLFVIFHVRNFRFFCHPKESQQLEKQQFRFLRNDKTYGYELFLILFNKMNNLEQEKYQFEDNENNRLSKLSYNKRIAYIVFCFAILIVIIYSLIIGELVIPGGRTKTYFKEYSLYALITSGFVWIYHLVVQLIADKSNDDKKNNEYFKQAYNTRIFAIILLIIAFVISFLMYDSKGNSKIFDPKYKKETKIYL